MSTHKDHPVYQRLHRPGPKRILSLDGGGIRGAVTLGMLIKLEKHLRERHQKPDLVLRDYFDLIGGTSTGSIIAASVAIGMGTEEILDRYGEMGAQIFEPAARFNFIRWIRQNFKYKNRPQVIEAILKRFYKHPEKDELLTLGSDFLTGGLCIVAKRVDTASVWPLHNNPDGKYYKYNRSIPLWSAVRASSAAPTYFPPTVFAYDPANSPDKLGAFIDGGVSAFNNPAMLMYLLSTQDGYGFRWKADPENLLLCSIGTGTSIVRANAAEIAAYKKKLSLFWASTVPNLMIRDCSDYNELLMQSISESPTARQIDSEIGHVSQLCGQPMLHYLRYNALVDEAVLKAQQAMSARDAQRYPAVKTVKDLLKMDKGTNVFHLAEIGKRAAETQLTTEKFDAHFPRRFDI